MRINKYLALKKHSTRRGADELIRKKQVFINGKLAVLGSKVWAADKVEIKFSGKPTPLFYFAYNKPRGVATHPENDGEKETKNTGLPRGVFPVGGLDKDSHGLIILTNDGRITDRLLSSDYATEKEYIVTARGKLRSSFKEKMEAGVQIERERTKPCKVKVISENTFRVILTEEKKNQIRRMCVALFQEAKDIERVRIANILIGNLKESAYRKIEGEELKTFLETLQLA